MNKGATTGSDASRAAYFQNLLVRLDSDRNRAGEKYEELRRKLIKFFEWNSCFPAEDLVDETLDRVARRLGAEQVRDISAFAWGVAKNVRQEAQKRSARLVPISDLPPSASPLCDKHNPEIVILEKMDQRQRSQCFHSCLQRLEAQARDLFLRYHNTHGPALLERQQLASTFGLTIAALRVRINRMREKLEKCVAICMKRNHLLQRLHRALPDDPTGNQ